MEKNNNKRDSQDGFSLIELSIALMIVGLLVAGFFASINILMEQKKLERQDDRMNELRGALREFILDDVNVAPNEVTVGDGGDAVRYPCPAPLTAGPGDAGYAQERCPTAAELASLAPGDDLGGVFVLAGTGNVPVLVGAVPTNTLSVSSQLGLDVHDNKLTYAVTLPLTLLDATLDPNATAPGAVEIRDEADAVITDTAEFAIVSHGEDGRGSYTMVGVPNGTGCDSGNAGDGDSLNCIWRDDPANNPASFRYQRAFSLAQTAAFYDDRMMFNLSGTGDDDAGWWRAADPTGNNITHKNPGNVGIGTDDPQFKLHVGGDTQTEALLVGEGAGGVANSQIFLGKGERWGPANLSDGSIVGSYRPKLYFGTDNNTAARVTIDENGNVGIGTNDPAGEFEVVGSAGDTNIIATNNTNSGAGTFQGTCTRSSDFDCARFEALNNGNTISGIRMERSGADDSGNITFKTADAGTYSEAMRIMPNGNVGIGTANPTQKLHVAGSEGSADAITIESIDSGARWQMLAHHDANDGAFTLRGANAAATDIEISANSGIGIGLNGVADIDPPDGVMAIMGGNIGVGTNSPQAKLHVAGAIKHGNQSQSGSCTANTAGSTRYNSTSKRMEFCDGTSWKLIGGGGGGSISQYSDTCNACGSKTQNLGSHDLCSLTGLFGNAGDWDAGCRLDVNGSGNWAMVLQDSDNSQATTCYAKCIDF